MNETIDTDYLENTFESTRFCTCENSKLEPIYFIGPIAADYLTVGSYEVLKQIGEKLERDVICIEQNVYGLPPTKRAASYHYLRAKLGDAPTIISYSNGVIPALELLQHYPEIRLITVAPATIPINLNRISPLFRSRLESFDFSERILINISRISFRNELIKYAIKIGGELVLNKKLGISGKSVGESIANFMEQYSINSLITLLETNQSELIYSDSDNISSPLIRKVNPELKRIKSDATSHNLEDYKDDLIEILKL